MNYILFLQTEIGWEKWIGEGVAISLIIIILIFILRALPVWKEVKLAEMEIRKKEAESFGQISASLNQLGSVTKEIAIEQRRATENVLILQRVNAKESNMLSDSVDILAERIDGLEESLMEKNLYGNRPKAVKKN